MKIIPFSSEYLSEMAQLFVDVYSEPGYEWNIETAIKYLNKDIKSSPEYCFVAIDEHNSCLGGVFCKAGPYYKGQLLLIDSLQIKPEFQNQGIGRALLQKAVETAKQNGVRGVHLLTDARKSFPSGWYQKLGFQPTHWVEFEAEVADINFKKDL